MRRAGFVIVATGLSVLACTGSDSPSGTSALSYTIVTVPREPARSERPVVFIDGVAQPALERYYASSTDALAPHRVELHSGDLVVASLRLSPALADCAGRGTVVSFTDTVCEYDSGDLRLGAPSGSVRLPGGGEGQCTIDGSASCNAKCNETSCGSGARCTSLVTSHAPLYSHLDCAPSGNVLVGSACTFTAGSGGDYDNCESGAVCVGGKCVALCSSACGTCGPIEGEPPELSFCM